MDINMLRAILTVLAFLSFIGIVIWAYHRGSRTRFEQAAQLPFEDSNSGNISGNIGGKTT